MISVFAYPFQLAARAPVATLLTLLLGTLCVLVVDTIASGLGNNHCSKTRT